MTRRAHGHIAVFARNHSEYLKEAVSLCQADASRRVTLRAANKWKAAADAVSAGSSIPIYFSAIGSDGVVEYAAELTDVQIYPSRGDQTTEALLALCGTLTVSEGLWEGSKSGKRVTTLFAISGCRRLVLPVPLTALIKISDGTPISASYSRAYVLVEPLPVT